MVSVLKKENKQVSNDAYVLASSRNHRKNDWESRKTGS